MQFPKSFFLNAFFFKIHKKRELKIDANICFFFLIIIIYIFPPNISEFGEYLFYYLKLTKRLKDPSTTKAHVSKWETPLACYHNSSLFFHHWVILIYFFLLSDIYKKIIVLVTITQKQIFLRLYQ